MENFKEIRTEELGWLALASIDKGDVARDKSANLHITAGQYLAEAKCRVQETKVSRGRNGLRRTVRSVGNRRMRSS